MKDLKKCYENNLLGTKYGDKGTVHSYIDVYEKYVSKFKSGISLLELGVGYGESLLMWTEYFEDADIIGVQLPNPNSKLQEIVETHKLNVVYTSATDPNLPTLLNGKTFDIIIDDASHKFIDQQTSFFNLKHLVKPGGYYFIEDVEDIDTNKDIFLAFHDSCEINDLREVKNRFDDVLITYSF
jgi:ubiquinone/menaquinone biosynthesis C-methylase UbiE